MMRPMALDVHSAADFYATAQGIVAARLIRERIASLWPDMAGQAVLGLGYAPPYLRLWREEARLAVAVTPAQLGAARWPAGGANLTCMAEEDALPFSGPVFDRVLLVHGLESAENARRMLREIWRVMKDDGRLMVVTPNRRGMWAYFEIRLSGTVRLIRRGRWAVCWPAACFGSNGGRPRCFCRRSRSVWSCAATGSGSAPDIGQCRNSPG